MMSPIANGPLQAIMQSKVAPSMQGRVFTLISSLCTAMMPISMVVAAPVAEAVGVRGWYWLGGIITVLAGAVGWMMPKSAPWKTGRCLKLNRWRQKGVLPSQQLKSPPEVCSNPCIPINDK